MCRSVSLAFFVLFLSLVVAVPASALNRSISRVELVQVTAPIGFENSIRYEVFYYSTIEGIEVEVFPSRAEKDKDFDLILAAVVRHYVENEYEAKGKYLDETSVKKSSPQEIRYLVSRNFVSKPWSKSSQKELASYLQNNSRSLALYRLDAYLDYATDKGDFFSGLDTNPLLFHFGTGGKRDRVTIIQVNQTNS